MDNDVCFICKKGYDEDADVVKLKCPDGLEHDCHKRHRGVENEFIEQQKK